MTKKNRIIKENLIYSHEEFTNWRKGLAEQVKQIRKEKNICRKSSVGPNGYPSYSRLSEIEKFTDDIRLSSLFLLLRVLDLTLVLENNATVARGKDNISGEQEPE